MDIDRFIANLKQIGLVFLSIGLVITILGLVPRVPHTEVLDTTKSEPSLMQDSAGKTDVVLSPAKIKSDSTEGAPLTEGDLPHNRIFRIFILVALVFVGAFMAHCALCLIAGPNADAARGRGCNDCCFGQGERCSLPKPWSMPFCAVKTSRSWFQSLCPFCYHHPQVGRDHAIREISRNYSSRLGAALLGVVGAALGGFFAYLRFMD